MVGMWMIALVLNTGPDVSIKYLSPVKPSPKVMQDIWYHEGFENGPGGWKSVDLTYAPPMWHPDTFKAYEGKSWWMGDPKIGGYLDHWYQVLDSPEVTLPSEGDLTLKFMMNVAVESLSGGYPPGYDGWDGCNVRISTDGGNSWTVLTPIDPPYNATSMFSFGWEHKEGKGIPGWGGSSNGWVPASFDLSGYAGQTVKIRWAFASDPGWCTINDSTLFGWLIDNIDIAGVFTNDGEDTTGFTRASLAVPAGDLWHIEESYSTPNPSHIARCSNNQGTYIRNLRNFWVSPLIPLPEVGVSGYLLADFAMAGWVYDADTTDGWDYMMVQLSPDTGRHWYYASNPTGDPDGTNYVYVFGDTTHLDPNYWDFFTLLFSQEIDITPYAGKDIMFRIGVVSDTDRPYGPGLSIDTFMIYGSGWGIEEKRIEMPISVKLTNPLTLPLDIEYQLPEYGRATLKVYNSLGEEIKTLVDKVQPKGSHLIKWDGYDLYNRRVPSGVYFINLRFSNKSLTRKFIIVE